MAMNKDIWGPNVANAVKAWTAANINNTDFVTDAQLQDLWKTITQEHKNHLNSNADIQLVGSEIPIPGAGLFDSVTSAAIAGQATNAAVTLTQKIK